MSRWVVGHQWIDVIVALAVALPLCFFAPHTGLDLLDQYGRRAVYQTLAGLSATLLGLTMTTISVLASNIDKGIGGSPEGMPKSLVVGISRPMFGLIRLLGLALLLNLVLLVIDTKDSPRILWPQPVLIALATVVVIRLTRVLTLLSHLLKARLTP